MLGPFGSVGDTIWGVDLLTSQLSIFDRSGLTLAAWRVEPNDGGAFNHPAALFSDGTALLPVFRRTTPSRAERLVLRTNWHGSGADTIAHLVLPTTEWVLEGADGSVYTSQPFTNDPIYGISSDGRFIAVAYLAPPEVGNDSIRVVVRTNEKNLIYDRMVPFRHSALTASMIDSAVAAKVHQLRLRAISESAIREGLFVPSHLAPISEVKVSTTGEVWLRPSQKDLPYQWLILSIRGDPVGELFQPMRTELFMIEGRTVWGVEKDIDGLPTVVRWEIVARSIKPT